MKNKLVSIIVPVYNVENFLDRCLDSLTKQSYNNIEIILVDDGSTDNSLKICNNWILKDPRIKVFHKNNGGLSSARNYGIKNANGEYYSFVDSDDVVDITFIEKLVENLEKNNADISMCGIKKIYTYKNVVDINKAPIDSIILNYKDFLDYVDLDNAYGSFVSNKLYKKELINDKIFNEKIYMYEDNLFTLEVCAKKPVYYYFDEKLYFYYIRNDSLSRKKFDERKCTGITSLNKTIDICKTYFPEYEKKYLIKKIKSLIWFKSTTNEKKYKKIINNELKKCHIYKNFFFNRDVSRKERVKFYLKMLFSNIIYYKNHR